MFDFEEYSHFYKFAVEVHLCVIAVDVEDTNSTKFLVVKQDGYKLPTLPLHREKTTSDVAWEILKRHTGITRGNWLNMQMVGIADALKRSDGDRKLGVLFAVMMPEAQPLKNSEWKFLPDLLESGMYGDHLELLKQAGMNI